MNHKKMTLKELYNAYDLSENQNRKWLVKISRYWLEKSKDEEINKIVIKTLEVVERYIKGQSTKEELQKAFFFARHHYDSYLPRGSYLSDSNSIRVASEEAIYFAAICAVCGAVGYGSFWAYAHAPYAKDYKELLLEVINEMDEFEREIRRKT